VRFSTSFRALEDALDSLGLTDFLGVKPEISVFACRPDIIVVYHSMRGIILVVEVKKPGIEVFTSHDVGGQIYDYLMGLLGTGIRPFGVLSSYDETCIAYLNDGGVSKEILEESQANYSRRYLRVMYLGIPSCRRPVTMVVQYRS